MKKMNLELCGLWEKKDKNGETFMVGSLGGVSLMVFKNRFKEKETHPDWRIVLGEREKRQDVLAPKEVDEIPF